MIYGLSGKPIQGTPYDREINHAGRVFQFSPAFLAAIVERESNFDCKVVSADGGHGLCQLTSSWPADWILPDVNLNFALAEFLLPAIRYWHGLERYEGNNLVRLVAATYNEGLSAAIRYHMRGNVDAGTTNDYGSGVLALYQKYVVG
ncbi:MAG: hypothetical protein NVSMB19_15940 [Vulcanimicrobiaceae bacterium]